MPHIQDMQTSTPHIRSRQTPARHTVSIRVLASPAENIREANLLTASVQDPKLQCHHTATDDHLQNVLIPILENIMPTALALIPPSRVHHSQGHQTLKSLVIRQESVPKIVNRHHLHRPGLSMGSLTHRKEVTQSQAGVLAGLVVLTVSTKVLKAVRRDETPLSRVAWTRVETLVPLLKESSPRNSLCHRASQNRNANINRSLRHEKRVQDNLQKQSSI